MSTAASLVVAVLAALGAACSFGVGVALQHRQVQRERVRSPLGLLSRLARRRLWLAGIGLAVAAYGLQAVALAFGPLAVVAPVVATDLLFALPIAAMWDRRAMRRPEWAGCALVAGGVAVFVVFSPQSAGRSDGPARDWLLAFGAVVLIGTAAVAAAVVGRGATRASLLAIAAGVVFGMTAAVTLSLTRMVRSGEGAAILARWQLWALLALGITGLLLSATAYKAGALRASLPIMDTVEPVSGVLIGAVVFGERLASSPGILFVQVAGAVSAVIGIMLLGPSPLAAAPAAAAAPRNAEPSFSTTRSHV
ncbi:MAG TPA: DMT family transporter [Streptosporangiaceae bacterium]|nr:DMT family transporter [Streptosporangiaceae bacterium]